MRKQLFTTILAAITTLSFTVTAYAVDITPYKDFLSFRARGANQLGSTANYTFYDLNRDGIKEAIVIDKLDDIGVPDTSIFVAGKNYLNNYNDNQFNIPQGMEADIYLGTDSRLYILYGGEYNGRVDYVKLLRMDYDGDNLVLNPVFEGYGGSNNLISAYSLSERELNWKDIHDLQNVSEADIVSYVSGWKNDGRWWYQNSDGSYPTNSWQAIDGSWYYFDGSGYMLSNQWISGEYYVGTNGVMLTNTTTPDGYKVDASGKWIR